ncbi:MAG: porin [Burkholderiales bacterium]|nr:porin [Burkholderiales bacterium]
MQKKLLAAAVLSAFAGAASAQSANVTLYGTLQGSFEFASATGADGTAAAPVGVNSSTRGGALSAGAYTGNPASQSTRTRMNPAGSNFGLRGTEDLGNGLSAWFQIEIATTLGAPPPNAGVNHGNAPSFRNTAVGVRSRTWGSIGFGSWDTPFNLIAVSTAQANGRSGAASTGMQANLLGATTLAYGAWSGQNAANACTAAVGGGAAACFNYGTNFDRRERGGLMWWSPNWNGFEARVHYHATMDANAVTASNRVNGGPALKPSIWSMSIAYTNGPLALGYGYDRQDDVLAYGMNLAGGIAASGTGTGSWAITAGAGAGATSPSGSKGTGHRLGGKYAFNLGGGRSLGISGLWESLKWTMSYNGATVADLSSLEKKAWRLQGNYSTGAHFFGLEYTRAGELKGGISGTANNTFNGGGTKAHGWILSYNYMMSKRTSMTAYYTSITNDTNANYSGIVFGGIATAAGADPKYYGIYLRHAF